MKVWPTLHDFVPETGSAISLPASSGADGMLVEVEGVLLGAVVEHALGVRFVAADPRVLDMDRSIWPNHAYAVQSARQLFKSARG